MGQVQGTGLQTAGQAPTQDNGTAGAGEVALTAAMGTVAQGTAKTNPPKAQADADAKTSTNSGINPAATDAASSPAAPTAANGNAAAQAAVAGKQDTQVSLADAVKGDKADGAPATAASPASHDQHSTGAAAQLQAALPDPTAQAAALPPQMPGTPQVTSASTPTVTVATGAPVPVSGLAVEIAASVQSGKSRFEVRLDPADLGRIDVRIDVNRSGQVTSHLIVEKPETLSMLRQDAPQLQQALNDAGLRTGSGGLQFSLRDQSSGQNNGNQQMPANAQRLIVSDENTVPAAVAGQSYGRMLGLSGGVDIRV